MVILNLSWKNYKLCIQPLLFEDLSNFKRVRDNCLLYLHNPRSYSLEETQQWYFRFSDAQRYLSITLDDLFVGYVRISKISIISNKMSCWIGMDLSTDIQGRGLGTFIYKVLFSILQSAGFTSVYLSVLTQNSRALHLYKKLGFEFFSTNETTKETTLMIKYL